MKKYALLIIVVISAAGLVWFSKRAAQVRSGAEATPAEVSKKAPMSIKALQSQPIAVEKLDPAPKATAPNEAQCRAFHEKIISMSGDEIKSEIDKGSFSFNSQCQTLEPKHPISDEFFAACKNSAMEKDRCLRAVFMYRARWTDLMTASQTDYLNMELPLLINKILAQMSMGTTPQKFDPDTPTIQMAEAVVNQKPDDIMSYRLMATVLMGNGAMASPARLLEVAKQGMEVDPNDTDMHELQLIVHANNKDAEAINKFVTEHPNSAPALYFQAVTLAREGDLQSPLALLEKAKQLDPKSDRYQKAIDEIKKGNKDVPGTAQINFSYDM